MDVKTTPDSSDEPETTTRKRVCQACDRCRLKKSKCNGDKPCSRCAADNTVCEFGQRKKAHDKVYPKGYVEMLERQQAQLVTALQGLYERAVKNEGWPGDQLKRAANGRPLTHDILDRLGALKIESQPSESRAETPDRLRRRMAFEENLQEAQKRLFAEGAAMMQRQNSSGDSSMNSLEFSPTTFGPSGFYSTTAAAAGSGRNGISPQTGMPPTPSENNTPSPRPPPSYPGQQMQPPPPQQPQQQQQQQQHDARRRRSAPLRRQSKLALRQQGQQQQQQQQHVPPQLQPPPPPGGPRAVVAPIQSSQRQQAHAQQMPIYHLTGPQQQPQQQQQPHQQQQQQAYCQPLQALPHGQMFFQPQPTSVVQMAQPALSQLSPISWASHSASASNSGPCSDSGSGFGMSLASAPAPPQAPAPPAAPAPQFNGQLQPMQMIESSASGGGGGGGGGGGDSGDGAFQLLPEFLPHDMMASSSQPMTPSSVAVSGGNRNSRAGTAAPTNSGAFVPSMLSHPAADWEPDFDEFLVHDATGMSSPWEAEQGST